MLFKRPTVEEMAHNYSVYLRTKTIGMLVISALVWIATLNRTEEN